MPSRASSSVDLKLAVSCGLTLIKIAKQYLLCKMHDHLFILSFLLLVVSRAPWLKHVQPGFITRLQIRNGPAVKVFACISSSQSQFRPWGLGTRQTKIAAEGDILIFYFYLSKKIRLDFSCESTA